MSQAGTLLTGVTPPPGSGIQTVTGNSGGPVGPNLSGNINIKGAAGRPITVDGNAGTFTETINIADATTSTVGVVQLATDAETIAGTNSTHVVVPSSLKAKLGTQTDHAVAIGNTLSGAFNWSNAGTDGMLLIAANAADPEFASLTSTGGTIAFTAGANSLNLEAVGSGASVTVDADLGSATPIANVLTLKGAAGGNISTTGAANNLTVAVSGTTNHAVQVGNASGSLTSVAPGATNTVLLGTGADPSFGKVPNAALVDSSITVTGDQNITVGGSPVALGGTLTLSFPDIDQYKLLTANGSGAAESLPAGTGTAGQVLTSNGAAAYPTWQSPMAGAVVATQFTSSGTWTKNANTQMVEIIIIGAGGGGGSGRKGSTNSTSPGGGGGGHSGATYMQFPGIYFSATPLSVTVPAGGIGGVSQTVNDTDGNDGGNPGLASIGPIIQLSPTSITTFNGGGGTISGPGVIGRGGGTGVIRYFNSSAFSGQNGALGPVNTSGVGGSGVSDTASQPQSAADINNMMAAGGGGGGGGAWPGAITTGGNGSNIRSCLDGSYGTSVGTIIVAAGVGAASAGLNGGAGNDAPFNVGYMANGSGGGGGGADGGAGGNGGYPGGAGGGGGGGRSGSINSGAGGNGADGFILIVEHLGSLTVV